jgi:hypothetical protein
MASASPAASNQRDARAIHEGFLQGIDAAHQRVQRFEAALFNRLETWRLKPDVQALMTYLGLVSVEHSSGPRQRLGAIAPLRQRPRPLSAQRMRRASPAATAPPPGRSCGCTTVSARESPVAG